MLNFAKNFIDVIYIPPEQLTEAQTAVPIINDTVTSATTLGEMLNTAIAVLIGVFFAAAVISVAAFAVKTSKSRKAAENKA